MQLIYAEQTNNGELIHITGNLYTSLNIKELTKLGFICSADEAIIDRTKMSACLKQLNHGDSWAIDFANRLKIYMNYLDESDSEVDCLQLAEVT